MEKRSFLIILLVFAVLLTGITAYAINDSKSNDTETVNVIEEQDEAEPVNSLDSGSIENELKAVSEELSKEIRKKIELDIAYPSQIIKSAKDEELTQEAIYNRMLNSIDYFDTASIAFQWRSNTEDKDILVNVTIDTDLRTHKVYQTRSDSLWEGSDSYEELISDGNVLNKYNNERKSCFCFGEPMIRTQAEEEFLAKTPRHYVGTDEYDYGENHWVHRADLTNATMASFCLFPENYAFGYLTDFSCWEITGELDYLGRKCIEINGTVDGYYGEKFNNETFCMYVDEATGILLMLEGYNAEGEVENFVHVSEVFIDQPEITCANIEMKINTDKYADYEFIE